ncbi:hypothetical protein LINGRAHAP2_LOCUS4940 [Linum grandiflorum]
MASGCSP